LPFLQLWDSQARGFSRPVVFVIANQRPELVDWVAFGQRQWLNEMTNKLQIASKARFAWEFGRYYRSLEALVNRGSDDGAIVAAKFSELREMMHTCGFPCEFEERE
jgi:hypothetical protein